METPDKPPLKSLEEYRADIDRLDNAIVDLLVERFQIVASVGRLKARDGIAVVQSARAEQVKERVAAMASAKGLDGDLLRDIYTLMIDHAHVLEQDMT